MEQTTAVRQALEVYKFPRRLATVRAMPLPSDVNSLLRAVSDGQEDHDLLADISVATALNPKEVVEFYIQQVLLHPAADAYRTLGVRPGAQRAVIRRNMALLLRWLHPDHNHNEDRTIYMGRVLEAWEQIKTADRRQSYDKSRGLTGANDALQSVSFTTAACDTGPARVASKNTAGHSSEGEPPHLNNQQDGGYRARAKQLNQTGEPRPPARHTERAARFSMRAPARRSPRKTGFFFTFGKWIRRLLLLSFAVIVIGFLLAPQDMMGLSYDYWDEFRIWIFRWL